jgi:hypothetical protein
MAFVWRPLTSGQLLAYLAQYGVASTFVYALHEDEHTRYGGTVAMDFAYLEKYDTKPDFEPYGGKAFFKVSNRRTQKSRANRQCWNAKWL